MVYSFARVGAPIGGLRKALWHPRAVPGSRGSSDPPAASSGSNPKARLCGGLLLCGGYSKGADHASVQVSAQSAPAGKTTILKGFQTRSMRPKETCKR
jgi:hypothetical protein